MHKKTFSPRLVRRAMADMGITTMRELSSLSGVGENSLYSMDSGRAGISLENAAKLSVALGCQIDDFFVLEKSTQVVDEKQEAQDAAVA